MTNLDRVLGKGRDIILATKACIVKAIYKLFPEVMYMNVKVGPVKKADVQNN